MKTFRCKLTRDMHGRRAFKEGLYYAEDIVISDDERTALIDDYGILHMFTDEELIKHFVEEDRTAPSPTFQRIVGVVFAVVIVALLYFGVKEVMS